MKKLLSLVLALCLALGMAAVAGAEEAKDLPRAVLPAAGEILHLCSG